MNVGQRTYLSILVVAALLTTLSGCGGGGDSSETAAPSRSASDSTLARSDDGDSSDTTADTADTTSPAADTAERGATVTVDGTTYEFPKIAECEIDGETWGKGWRKLNAWSADGYNHLDITIGNAESSRVGLTSDMTVTIGLTNPNTLDRGNPDEEWTTGLGTGDTMTSTLTPTGASGSAEVVGGAQKQLDSPHAQASFSFSC